MMRAILLFMLTIGLVFGTGSFVFAQEVSPTGRSTNVEVTLKTSHTQVIAGQTFHVALDQKIAPSWHTYWRNPGDSGEPTDITWTLSEGVTAGAIKWPAPTAIPFGPLVNYGFSDQVTLPVAITIPANAKIGDTITLGAAVRWLECADVCIPGDAKVGIYVTVGATATQGPDAAQIDRAIAGLPAKFPGTVRLTDLGSGGFQLVVKGADAAGAAYFFPYEVKMGALIDFAQPQEFVTGKDGYGLNLVKSSSVPADLKGPIGGVLVLGKDNNAKAYEIAADYEEGPAGTEPALKAAPAAPTPSIGLFLALAMALAGGLILNLMPCVFPILSMKALSLLEASHDDAKAARAHGLWYGGGVIASFLALAATLIGLQAAGLAVGWGFQLQNPAIVIGLAILMVWIGFNLLGFFEFGGALQNVGGGLSQAKGASGSFLTGVLAVVVAAPCTAPFMGAALGFAATQTPMISLLVFAALGLGFALPFVALTYMPGLLRALPRPGPWMARLREALAFPMFATAIWLIWVASAQAGQAGVLAALVGVLGAGLSVWLLRTWLSAGGKALATLIGLASVFWALNHAHNAPTHDASQSSAQSNAWSEQRVAQLQSEGKTVFVNFTADWCVTCKVNEVGAFKDPAVAVALSGENATYLVADWTNRDESIAKALASHGRIGVPLYLVYRPGIAEPQILPQVLTSETILSAVR
jgi:thiol:disulfide interchange protein